MITVHRVVLLGVFPRQLMATSILSNLSLQADRKAAAELSRWAS
jgi:hypothetical protein